MSVQVAPPSLVASNLPYKVTTHPWLAVTKSISSAGRSSGLDGAPVSVVAAGATFASRGMPSFATLTVIHLESTTADGPGGRPCTTSCGFQLMPPSSVANNTTTPG